MGNGGQTSKKSKKAAKIKFDLSRSYTPKELRSALSEGKDVALVLHLSFTSAGWVRGKAARDRRDYYAIVDNVQRPISARLFNMLRREHEWDEEDTGWQSRGGHHSVRRQVYTPKRGA